MRNALKYLCLPLLLCGFHSVAVADTLDLFSLQVTGLPITGSATLSASPTPSSFVSGTSFTLDDISTTFEGTTFTEDVTFLTSGGAEGGGQVIGGDKLFSGPESMPSFLLVNFMLSGDIDLGFGEVPLQGVLTISQIEGSPVPEPLPLSLVGSGLLGLVELVRQCLRP